MVENWMIPERFTVGIRQGLTREQIRALAEAARRFYEASGFDLDETAKVLHHGSPTTTRVYLNQPERETGAIWESVAALYGV